MMNSLLPLLGLVFPLHGPISTPYAKREPLSIRISPIEKPVPKFGLVDIPVEVRATFDNPFDPDDIRVDAEISGPRGAVQTVPGFFSADFDRKLVDGKEVLTPKGTTGWHVRFSPDDTGNYSAVVWVKDRSGRKSATINVSSVTSNFDGFIRLSPKDKRFFAFDSGRNYWPIGANVCWAGPKGMYDYEDWFAAYGKANCNYARIWLSPFWTTFAIEQTGKPSEGKGMGQFDLANAWRIDYAFDLAKQNGLNLMLCLDSYNILRDKDASPSWEGTPHNLENGGPLRDWGMFWSSEAMDKFYRDKLRYLVARYGANSNLFAWEFWNEVDLTRDFDLETVGQWHRRMGKTLRDLDPFRHLVTTSMSDAMGSRELQLLPELDFVQTHAYTETPGEAVAMQQGRKVQWGKAHFVGEVGADSTGPRTKDDPEGFQIHDALWTSIATASSGSAMPWWWDNYIAPNNLYPIFAVASKFVKDLDWSRESFQSIDPTVIYAYPQAKPLATDLVFDSGIAGFRAGPENQPRTVTIQDGSVSGDKLLSNLLHGAVNHPELRNPVTFELKLTRSTHFDVEVGDVSGYGGANLRIYFDSELVMSREFANTNTAGKTDTLHQYAGKYGIDIPAGRHTLRVENTGNDWLACTYRFKNLITSSRPPLAIWASLGNNTALIWAKVQGRTWRRVIAKKDVPSPVPPTVIGLEGLASGAWNAEIWDTRTGIVVATRRLTVSRDGHARFDIPSVDKDVAIKLTRNQ